MTTTLLFGVRRIYKAVTGPRRDRLLEKNSETPERFWGPGTVTRRVRQATAPRSPLDLLDTVIRRFKISERDHLNLGQCFRYIGSKYVRILTTFKLTNGISLETATQMSRSVSFFNISQEIFAGMLRIHI